MSDPARLTGLIFALLLIFSGCSRPVILALADPYWIQLVGKEGGERTIRRAADRQGLEVRVVIPPPLSNPATVVDLAFPPEGQTSPPLGIVLSPLYAGEVFTQLRTRFPELPIALLLAPPSLAQGYTAVILEDRQRVFEQRGRTAVSLLGTLERPALVVMSVGRSLYREEGQAFIRGWNEAGGGALAQLELTSSVSSNEAVDMVRARLEALRPSALFLFAGALNAPLLGLVGSLPYAADVPPLLLPPETRPLFTLDRDWEGLYTTALETILKAEYGVKIFVSSP